jgi:hypothetical protein
MTAAKNARPLNEIAVRWATPTVAVSKGGAPQDSKGKLDPRLDVVAWSTPRATDGEKGGPNMRGAKGDLPLPGQAANWPTPQALDGIKAPKTYAGGNPSLPHSAKSMAEQSLSSLPAQTPSTSGEKSSNSILRSPQLNPRFVFWLMGWPPIAPDTSDSRATEFARYKRRMRSALCGLLSRVQ